MTDDSRHRITYIALAIVTIAVGLGVHLGGQALPAPLRDALGDALWAVMLTWWVSAAFPTRSLRFRALLALAGCFAVEASQLIHTGALDALRRTQAGHLVLGSGFDPRDFVAYAAGVIAAAGLESATRRP